MRSRFSLSPLQPPAGDGAGVTPASAEPREPPPPPQNTHPTPQNQPEIPLPPRPSFLSGPSAELSPCRGAAESGGRKSREHPTNTPRNPTNRKQPWGLPPGHGRLRPSGEPAEGGLLLHLPGLLQRPRLHPLRAQLLPGLHHPLPQEARPQLLLPPVQGGGPETHFPAQPRAEEPGGDRQEVGGQSWHRGPLPSAPGAPQALLPAGPGRHLRGVRPLTGPPRARRGAHRGGRPGLQRANPKQTEKPQGGKTKSPRTEAGRGEEEPEVPAPGDLGEVEDQVGVQGAAAVPGGAGASPPGLAGRRGEAADPGPGREREEDLPGDLPARGAHPGAGRAEPTAREPISAGGQEHPEQVRDPPLPQGTVAPPRHQIGRGEGEGGPPGERSWREGGPEVRGRPTTLSTAQGAQSQCLSSMGTPGPPIRLATDSPWGGKRSRGRCPQRGSVRGGVGGELQSSSPSRCEARSFQQPAEGFPSLEKTLKDLSQKKLILKEALRKFKESLPRELDVQWANVTLDPDTANPHLVLSEDRRSVRWDETPQNLPDSPQRFDTYCSVLGREGFTAGRHYWEAELGKRGFWALGVARDSAWRKGWINLDPSQGIWAVGICGDRFQAFTSFERVQPLGGRPRTIRVSLDYEKGHVSFFNVEGETLAFAFPPASFNGEKILPFFWVWESRIQLAP